MSYRFLDHTADVGVEIHAPSRDELYAEALVAFTDTVTPVAGVRTSVERRIELTAADPAELMVTWLEELLYLFEVDDLFFARADVTVREAENGELVLRAVAHGEPEDPDRHPIKVLIKGVTYHHLEVRREAEGSWLGRIILDI